MSNSINNIKFLGRKIFGIKNLSTSNYDPDALAYFTLNTAITNTADKNAINTFYLGLKSDNIYTKIYWMILPLWSTATNNKWNLINNRTFDLTFSSGWTYASNGITPLNAYADTFLIPLTTLNQNNTHLSFYSGTNDAAGNKFEIGTSGNPSTGTNSLLIGTKFTGNLFYGRVNALVSTQVSNTDSSGFYITSRLNSTNQEIFRNGVKTTALNSSTGLSANSINIVRWNNPTGTPYYSTRQCRFASSGEGFTDTDATKFKNRVNTLMTYFGINTF